jgi:excisionase family DNA binding protein
MVEKLYTPQEAAGMLKVTRKTIYNWIDAGSIQAIKLPGSGVRIKQSEIMRILSTIIIRTA